MINFYILRNLSFPFSSFKNITSANNFVVRSLTSKALRPSDYKRPEPFPYKTKKMKIFTPSLTYFDDTISRFDENTKMIVVEGNIGSGKTKVAKYLAEQFDFKYYPEVNMDLKYITPYGYDLRIMDPHLPEKLQSCDIERFYTTPKHKAVARFQFDMYQLRFLQYLDALCHVLNSGQGVVLERSPFSDFVFAKTMHKHKYIRDYLLRHYLRIYDDTIGQLFPPHIIIYLDAPTDVLMERIKERNIPYEVNSKVLNEDYLKSIDHFYKQEYLKSANVESEVLIFDWTEYGDMDQMVETLERLDLDNYKKSSHKAIRWREPELNRDWIKYRYHLTTNKLKIVSKFFPVDLNVPELIYTHQETLLLEKLYNKIPGTKFPKGWNADCGDNILFKTDEDYLYVFTPTR